jgi:DNA-binding CsgD family transcriptional regulator
MKQAVFVLLFFIFSAIPQAAFSQAAVGSTAAGSTASRKENGNVFNYATLNEAFAAAEGISIEEPDEITVLDDLILTTSIIIDTPKHIRLLPGGGDRTIMRCSDNLDYPLFWVSGDASSLSLGSPRTEGSGMEHSLSIDGGYLNTPPILANTPLIAVSGRDAKLIMYDGVSLQNNYNIGPGEGSGIYQNGSGVFIRTVNNDMEHLAEFIMKGGVIQGNTNNTQNLIATGGGVMLTGFGLFTMEGGTIKNNTAYLSGGGLSLGSRASFAKTGGIIYGNDAPLGYQNAVTEGTPYGEDSIKIFGYAVRVNLVDSPGYHFRDDTVGENERLSYLGKPAENGIFGTGDKWDNPLSSQPTVSLRNRFILFCIVAFIVLCLALVFIRKIIIGKQAEANPGELELDLTIHEKNVLDLLLSDLSIKQIADALKLSPSGVTYHRNKIYRKLGIKNRKELLVKYRKKEDALADS